MKVGSKHCLQRLNIPTPKLRHLKCSKIWSFLLRFIHCTKQWVHCDITLWSNLTPPFSHCSRLLWATTGSPGSSHDPNECNDYVIKWLSGKLIYKTIYFKMNLSLVPHIQSKLQEIKIPPNFQYCCSRSFHFTMERKACFRVDIREDSRSREGRGQSQHEWQHWNTKCSLIVVVNILSQFFPTFDYSVPR